MKSNIFIPRKIKVGFQKRHDTYTQKLAYVIYYDEKGKLRKEKSWNSWRDSDIEAADFTNEPIEGFVLNKKAGGYSTGWNHRQTYVRVYDPRGFEFEISIPNLLYILENTNSIKGKGLEGEFVYGWDGTELVLIPTSSPDYNEIMEYNNMIFNKKTFKTADMIPGATYLTKNNEQLVYIGKFHKYDWDGERKKSKYFYFYDDSSKYNQFTTMSSLNNIIAVVSEECVENYADLREKVEHTISFSPIDPSKDEYHFYTCDEFIKKFQKSNWLYCYNSKREEIQIQENYRNKGSYLVFSRSRRYSDNIELDSLEEIYEYVKPMYRIRYLANGKLYMEGK